MHKSSQICHSSSNLEKIRLEIESLERLDAVERGVGIFSLNLHIVFVLYQTFPEQKKTRIIQNIIVKLRPKKLILCGSDLPS
jgi:hypothetical protein